MRAVIILLGGCVLLAMVAKPCTAVTISTGDEVTFPQGTPVQGDILAAGREVTIQSEVRDLTAGGGTVKVTGPVKATAMLAGYGVSVSGPVSNDIYATGQRVRISSPIGDNAYVLGSYVEFAPTSRVKTDLLVAGDTLNLLGSVGRVVRAAGGDITLGGEVGGDVYARASGRIRLLKGALIRGNLCYESPEAVVVNEGARILGSTTRNIPPSEKLRPLFWPRVALSVGSVIGAIVFGIMLVVVFPTGMQLAANTLRYSFWQSAGVGAIALVGVPLACMVASATLIGLPAAVCVALVYAIAIYAAPILAGLSLGQSILGWRREEFARPVLSMAFGVIFLSLLKLIPVLGFFLRLVLVALGLGAISITWWRSRGFRIVRQRS